MRVFNHHYSSDINRDQFQLIRVNFEGSTKNVTSKQTLPKTYLILILLMNQ